VQGLGGAVVSAVSLSLIMNLFTEPAERAKAMGVYGFVCAGRRQHRRAAGRPADQSLELALDLPGQSADRHRRLTRCASRCCPSAAAGARRTLDVAGAVTVTTSLMLAVYAIVNGNEAGWTSVQTLGCWRRRWRCCSCSGDRGARAASADAAGPVPAAQRAVANVVGVLWAAAMFAWFFISALYLQRCWATRRCRSGWPSCRPT
jgi:hypothetical protein